MTVVIILLIIAVLITNKIVIKEKEKQEELKNWITYYIKEFNSKLNYINELEKQIEIDIINYTKEYDELKRQYKLCKIPYNENPYLEKLCNNVKKKYFVLLKKEYTTKEDEKELSNLTDSMANYINKLQNEANYIRNTHYKNRDSISYSYNKPSRNSTTNHKWNGDYETKQSYTESSNDETDTLTIMGAMYLANSYSDNSSYDD